MPSFDINKVSIYLGDSHFLINLVGIMGRTDLMGDPYMGLGPIYGFGKGKKNVYLLKL